MNQKSSAHNSNTSHQEFSATVNEKIDRQLVAQNMAAIKYSCLVFSPYYLSIKESYSLPVTSPAAIKPFRLQIIIHHNAIILLLL